MKLHKLICARCRQTHLDIELRPFTIPPRGLTHFAMCPVTDEPVFMKRVTTPLGTWTRLWLRLQLLLSALCLALTACGPQYQVSPCGPMLDGYSETFSVAACDAVDTVASVYGRERAELAAQRAVILVAPELLPGGTAGETICENGRIVLDRDDWYPSALAHELTHLAECDATDNAHVTWGSKDDPSSTWGAIERFHAIGRINK